jgi:hypothetical protein
MKLAPPFDWRSAGAWNNEDMKTLEPRAHAASLQNQDFIWVYTESGLGLVAYDPQGKDVILGLDADDAALGVAVREALACSRILSPKEAMKFLDYRTGGDEYKGRVKSLMEMHGYKSKSAMFKNMEFCSITLAQGTIEINPTIHKTLDGWVHKRSDGIEDLRIPANSPAHEIGAALRLAFSRCLE